MQKLSEINWLLLDHTNKFNSLKNELDNYLYTSSDLGKILNKNIKKIFSKHGYSVIKDNSLELKPKKDYSLNEFLEIVKEDTKSFIKEIVINDIIQSYNMYGYSIIKQ